MGTANIVASGIGPAIQGGIGVGNELEQAQQQQEATKQAQQTTEERQLELNQQQQLMPGDTYIKLGKQQYEAKEQDFLNNIQQPNALQERETELQQQHQQVAQAASVYAFNQTMLGENKAAADFVSKNKILNPQGIEYADAQILDANGQPTNDPDQGVTFRLQPADKNQAPHDVPYQTLANLSRMHGTSVVQGKNGEMLVQTISPAMNKGQPMVTAAYTPTKINATREGDLYKETGPDANGQVLNGGGAGGPLQGGALAREQKYQGIIKDGNQTIFKTLGADAFGSLNPEQQPLAMRATYLFEQGVRSGKQVTPAQAIAQAKQDLPILQKRGQSIVPTGFQPFEGGGATTQPSDTTNQARAAFNKILGKSQAPGAPAAAPQPAPQPAAQQPAAQPVSRPMPARAPVPAPAAPAAPSPSPVSIMPDANAATPPPQPAGGIAPTPAAAPTAGSLQQVGGNSGPGPFEKVASAISKGITAARAAGYHPGVLPGPNGTSTEIRPGMQTSINGKRITFQSYISNSPNGPVWLVRDDQGGLYNYVAPTR